jgi:hypothetical protein
LTGRVLLPEREAYSVNADQADASTVYQYFDTLSCVHGKHQMTFGAESRLYQDNYYSNNQERGVLTIENFNDFLLGLRGPRDATSCTGQRSGILTLG